VIIGAIAESVEVEQLMMPSTFWEDVNFLKIVTAEFLFEERSSSKVTVYSTKG
jgi:hypothetical protein